MLTWMIDHRDSLAPVGHQGSRPTCLSWAVSTVHDYVVQQERMSIEYLHWSSGNYSGGRGNVLAASASLQLDGQPPRTQWEYLDTCDEQDATYAPPTTVVGPFSRASLQAAAIDVDFIAAQLLAARLPIVCLRVTDSFIAARGGVVELDGPGQTGHATVAVGVALFTGIQPMGVIQPGERLVCLRNSWGNTWGVDGHCLISEPALSQCGLGVLSLDLV